MYVLHTARHPLHSTDVTGYGTTTTAVHVKCTADRFCFIFGNDGSFFPARSNALCHKVQNRSSTPCTAVCRQRRPSFSRSKLPYECIENNNNIYNVAGTVNNRHVSGHVGRERRGALYGRGGEPGNGGKGDQRGVGPELRRGQPPVRVHGCHHRTGKHAHARRLRLQRVQGSRSRCSVRFAL